MRFTSVAFSLACAASAHAVSTLNEARSALQAGHVIPDVLPVDFVPSTLLDVKWGEHAVDFGNIFSPPNETVQPPSIQWGADPAKFYTVALVDPDAPSRANPYRALLRHWLVVNIPGGNVSAGNSTGTAYLNPNPFPGCGRKRFVWVVAEQEKELPELSVSAARPKFDLLGYLSENKMSPIGANYFQVDALPADSCQVPGASSISAAPTSAATPTADAATSAAPTATAHPLKCKHR
ncbi:PEBP-like protein [Martensiomyces pterosporus]|nr:PEBP-like protein [Martensiomyces pterosporus]